MGRNASGVPESGQNLGTAAFPWGSIRATSLILGGSSVDTSQIVSPVNRIVSGKKRTTSNQMQFLTPNGAAASFLLAGATTNLVLDINGAAVTVSTDITKSSLTLAPSSNNTALVNDTAAAGQADTRLWGEPEHRKKITMDTVGTNISNLVGKWAAFKLNAEYFLGFVESTTVISKCRRGYFYNSSLAPMNRVVFSNNDTLTLMSLGWVFVQNDGVTIDVTYNNPVWDFVAPSSPVTGDYWYDLNNQVWKRYDGASFQIISRTFIGNVIIDTANCVGARCVDVTTNYKDTNTFELEVSTTEIIRQVKAGAAINVVGRDFNFYETLPQWNITTDLATSSEMYDATEQASRMYYLYLSDAGQRVISDISPYYRPDLKGWYHPHNTWRMVGMGYNNASSNIVAAGAQFQKASIRAYGGSGHGATDTKVRALTTLAEQFGAGLLRISDATHGDTYTCFQPGIAAFSYTDDLSSGQTNIGISLNSTELTTAIASIAVADSLGFTNSVGASAPGCKAAMVALKIGDVIRPHTAGTADETDGHIVQFHGTLESSY